MIAINKDNKFLLHRNINKKTNKFFNKRHFNYIEKSLAKEEFINASFTGLHNYKGQKNHDRDFAYAITDNYFILAKDKFFKRKIEKISLDDIIFFDYDILDDKGLIRIDTKSSSFTIAVDKDQTRHIFNVMNIYI